MSNASGSFPRISRVSAYVALAFAAGTPLYLVAAGTPFSGTPISITAAFGANATIEAENFDKGGEGQGYHGYHYRLLYGQGPNAPGGAYSYLLNGRMLGGFGVIAWPVTYGETGVMTFIVNQSGDVYERDLGPETPQRAAQILLFDPDKEWGKADTVPP